MAPRRATASDLDAIVDTLVEAHVDYVWETWALPGPRRRERLGTLVRLDVELLGLPYRDVWVYDDEATSVVIWEPVPPRAPDPDAAARVRRAAEEAQGEHRKVVEEVDAILAAHRPSEPHWFLATMGTRPDRQREGLGTAVLQPVLERLDRIGAAACLETSSAENVAFYSRLGFSVTAHLDQLPAAAPETWLMWREPVRGPRRPRSGRRSAPPGRTAPRS